jgi:quercetin dioxygenase-like cupin family protein
MGLRLGKFPCRERHKIWEEQMVFWQTDKLKLDPFRPGIASRAAIGDSLIMVCMEIEAGREDSGHLHPFDQCGMVLEGRIEMFVGDEARVLEAHDSYFIPAGVRHGWKTLAQPVKLLDICPKQQAG